MNPFLHNPVATCSAGHFRPARAVPFPTRRAAAGSARSDRINSARAKSECVKSKWARSRWARSVGTLALAAGMSLAAMPAQALDINTATAEQLEGVRGLGPKTVQIIVKERERGGRFESMEDLSDRVRGIGHKKAQSLQAAGLKVEGRARPIGASPAESDKHATGKISARPDRRHSGRQAPGAERAASRRGASAAGQAVR